MVKQNINIGTIANDGTGDTMRVAGRKINENFSELYSILGGDSAAVNERITKLTDSGFDLIGTTYKTKVTFTNPTAKHTITIPNVTGTVTINTATQTLTNKTLTAPNIDDPVLSDVRIMDADSSHSYRLIAGGLTANTYLRLPSLSDSDTLVVTNAAQTISNKILESAYIHSPKIVGHIQDSSGNDLVHFTSAASADNHIDIKNAASGSPPTIAVEGNTDTNINLNIDPLGSGSVRVKQMALGVATISATGTVSTEASYITFTGSASATLTVGNGTTTGQIKVITHDGSSGVATIAFASAANFAQGTSIALDANDTVQLIWNNTNSEWNIIGGYGYAVS